MKARERFDESLHRRLEERKAQGLLRTLVQAGNTIDFSSNDYLGFARSGLLNSTTALPSGATGSRLVTGNAPAAEITEHQIAAFHGFDAALVFNTGYMANVGLLSCIASKHDTFIADEYVHASMIDGMRLSFAARLKFRHNDITDLKRKLQKAKGNKFVVVESIYSMDGDEAPLQDIVALCTQYNALLIVDEAHAIGVFGKRGEGLVAQYGLQQEVYACVYTFGKALGLHGAAIAGSDTLRQFLINHARSFIYATALPPHSYLQIDQAYRLLPSADRVTLYSNIQYYRERTNRFTAFSFLNNRAAIQGIVVGDNFKAKALAEELNRQQIFIKAILSPTVPKGTERLRICLHSYNTREEIDTLVKVISSKF